MGNSLVGSRLSKKASAVTFSHDSAWLLVADKFGIVYVFSTVQSDAIHKPVLILAHCCSIITGLVWVCCLNSAPCMWWSFELAFLPLHKLLCYTYSRYVLNICMYISPPETSTPSNIVVAIIADFFESWNLFVKTNANWCDPVLFARWKIYCYFRPWFQDPCKCCFAAAHCWVLVVANVWNFKMAPNMHELNGSCSMACKLYRWPSFQKILWLEPMISIHTALATPSMWFASL